MSRTVYDPPEETGGDNWLMETIKRAIERSDQVPPWAKPVRIKK
jgi:hypothetical protein